MTLPIIHVEGDGELEIPAAIVGDIPPGAKFTVEKMIIPETNTVFARAVFLVTAEPVINLG